MHARSLSFFFPHIYVCIILFLFTILPKNKRQDQKRERERERRRCTCMHMCLYACVLKNELGPSNLRKSLCLLLCYWNKPRPCIFLNPNPTSKEKRNILGIILYTWSLEHRLTSIYAFFFSMNCLIINHFLYLAIHFYNM